MKRKVERIEDAFSSNSIALDCFHVLRHFNNKTVGDETDCPECDQLKFPTGLTAYKKTPLFNQDTIPKGFKRAHSTKKGVWAIIHIISGNIAYVIDDLDNKRIDLNKKINGIISPQMEHHLDVTGDVELYVEFYSKK